MHFSEKHHNCFSFTCRFNKIPGCCKYTPLLYHFPGCPYSSQRRAQRRSLRRNIFVTFAKSNAKALLTPPASKMQTRRRVLRPAGGFFSLRQSVMPFLYMFSTACYTVPVPFLHSSSTAYVQFLYHSSTVKIRISTSGDTVPPHVSYSFDSTPIQFLYHFL